ncbi:MAG: S-layer homology domain-containing protein [Clostridia bacterium]|nr:S-layer homology domain-containing protein [Clostridia bacterium]
MKKRFGLMLGLVLAFAIMFAVAVSAAGNTVAYVMDGGEGDGTAPDKATSSLTTAYSSLDLSKDCTVVICGAYTQSATWVWKDGDYDGSVTFTSVYDGVDYRKTVGASYSFKAVRFVCFGDTRFENLDFVCTGTNMLLVGQFNPVTIGEGVTMSGSGMTGGSIAKSFCILGGYQNGQSTPPASSDADANITVLSGSALYIVPFSRSVANSNYTGTANITVGGSANVKTLHLSMAGPDGAVGGDVKVTIEGKANVDMVYGCTSNTTVNSVELTWKSGTVGEFYWTCPNTASKLLTIKNGTTLNATPTAKAQSNFSTVASNFDKMNEIADDKTDAKDTLTNQTVIYVKDGGNGNGSSADKALSNLADAFDALDLSKDCTVVICGTFTQSGNFDYGKDYTGSVTFTSVYGGTDYRKSGASYQFSNNRFVCYGETKFENMDFVCTKSNILVIGQHNPVTVGEGVTMSGDGMTGNSVAKSFCILGGYQHRVGDYPYTDDSDTNITVLSGSKLYIIPYSREMLGDYMGTANVTVGGTANVSVLHGSAAYPDTVSVGDVKITVKDNAVVNNFYGCTQITNVNSCEFNWLGGTIGKFEWNCSATPDADINIANKTVLKAADAVKLQTNYAEVAANFNIVTTTADTTDYVTPAAPVIETNYGAARGLYTLGLAQGYDTTGTNFGLSDDLTRIQTVVQVIRFLGVEDEVKAGTYTHPFTDVPAWANNYVGYAYANNITSGRSATKFDPDGVVDEMQFLTFMLRAIGYSDKDGDFVWNNPYALANKVRMSKADGNGSIFTRGDAFRTSWDTLFATAKDGDRVYANLEEAGVFTASELTKAVTEAQTAKVAPDKSGIADLDESGYHVISVEEYKDKTFAGLMAQFTGFLSGYEFAQASDGTARLAMADSWFELCNGPYAEYNSRNVHEDKHKYNESAGIWEVWNDDDFSIDVLNQYILRDMYKEYGTFASKKIKDGWITYNVYDMGGGHRSYGAYGLFSKYNYLPQYVGATEFGNEYNVNGEPYIANETLGMDAAGMPNVALDMAEIFGGTTSDREPTLWLRYFTALISMAYYEDDIPALMREAQDLFPKDSQPYRVVDIVFELYEKYPNDWRRAVVNAEKLCGQAHYDWTNIAGETGINCSFILIGMLYGEGDFYETCKIIGLAGHGGDSTTPVGLTVAAVACGWEGVDEETKAVINEKVWQDGKGTLVNLASQEKQAYWMHCVGLPERIKMADILDMYQENFESILLENGGKIENGNYYIPKSNLKVLDTYYYNDFESGDTAGMKTKGNVDVTTVSTYAGEYSARVGGSAATDSELYVTVNGLTAGESYRVTAFASVPASTTLTMFVREAGGADVASANVSEQTKYAKRQFIFTATAATMEVGFRIPKGTSDFKYAVIDEFEVVKATETSAGTATITNAASDNLYKGAVGVAVNANTTKEVYLKVTFANTTGQRVDVNINLDGAIYGAVPLSKTGLAKTDGSNTTYIPVIAKNGKTEYNITLNTGSSSVYIYDVELVTVDTRM